MPGCTAGSDDDTLGVEETIFVIDESGEGDVILAYVDTSTHGVGQGTRLLEDLLEHEMRIAAFLELREREFEALDLRGLGDIIDSRDIYFFSQTQRYDLFILHVDDLIGIFDDRRSIGSEEILVLTNTDYER